MISEGRYPIKRYLNSILNNNTTFVWFFVFTFLCLSFLKIMNHEMWRDELQAWMIARDSSSILNLFENLRYMGHPGLWYICLYILNIFSIQPIVMQLFHLILAAVTVYIFMKYSPFTKPQKILFIFGYFPSYEYAIVSRNYILSILLVFLLCTVYRPGDKKNYLTLSFILFFITQTSVYGLIIAISFGFMFIFEYFVSRKLRKSLSKKKKEIVVCMIIFVLGVSIAVLQLIKPADSAFAKEWFTSVDLNRIKNTISTIWRGYIPIPKIKLHFWDTNILSVNQNFKNVLLIFSIILLCFSIIVLSKKKAPLFLYCSGTAGILIFTYIKFLGSVRHHGHLFILFIASLWLSSYYPSIKLKSKLSNNINKFFMKYKNRFIVVILSAHLIAGVIACSIDLIYPFSSSKEVAKFIKDEGMNDMLILGDIDYATAAVSGYLNREIYYPRVNRFGSFIIWNTERIKDQNVTKRARELSVQRKEDILLILNYELNSSRYPIIKVKEFNKSVVESEVYYLYIMKY